MCEFRPVGTCSFVFVHEFYLSKFNFILFKEVLGDKKDQEEEDTEAKKSKESKEFEENTETAQQEGKVKEVSIVNQPFLFCRESLHYV